MSIPSIVIDEGALVGILYSTTWKALGSPKLVTITQNFLAFNRGTNQPLGILPKLPITLGGKTVYIVAIVFQGPLDFNLLLGHDYVYVMGALDSCLFLVMCFLHERSIVIIKKLTLIGPESISNKPSSLNCSYMKGVSAPQQVNYMATCSMPTSNDDLVVDVVHHVLGALEPDFSFGSLEMYPF